MSRNLRLLESPISLYKKLMDRFIDLMERPTGLVERSTNLVERSTRWSGFLDLNPEKTHHIPFHLRHLYSQPGRHILVHLICTHLHHI